MFGRRYPSSPPSDKYSEGPHFTPLRVPGLVPIKCREPSELFDSLPSRLVFLITGFVSGGLKRAKLGQIPANWRTSTYSSAGAVAGVVGIGRWRNLRVVSTNRILRKMAARSSHNRRRQRFCLRRFGAAEPTIQRFRFPNPCRGSYSTAQSRQRMQIAAAAARLCSRGD